jgi:hypothetical protein
MGCPGQSRHTDLVKRDKDCNMNQTRMMTSAEDFISVYFLLK